MNIEDKYNSHFKDYQPEVDPQLWNQLEKKLDQDSPSKSKVWWMTASILVLVSLLINNPESKITPQLASVVTLTLAKQKQIETKVQLGELQVSSKTYTEKVTAPQKHIPIRLNKIALAQLDYQELEKTIIGSPITLVTLRVKEKQQQQIHTPKPDNFLEGFLEHAIQLIKKNKPQIQIPTIEIDYQSLIAQNQ